MNDETTDACLALGPVDRTEWHELLELYQASNADERAVLMMVARQLQGKGRKEYGPLHLAPTMVKRTEAVLRDMEFVEPEGENPHDLVLVFRERRDFSSEALAEIGDALAYVAIALRQVAIRRSNGKAG